MLVEDPSSDKALANSSSYNNLILHSWVHIFVLNKMTILKPYKEQIYKEHPLHRYKLNLHLEFF